MNASDLFVKQLEQEGVQYVFGVPGEENLDLLESIRTSSLTLVLTRHEQAAGFMAATMGRLTGQVQAALSTLGPGATNFTTAAAYAQLGGMPLLLITGQKPIKSSKQGQFQIVDIVEMMRPLTKYTKQIVGADTVPSIVREACRCSMEERPGAVHIELPEDIAREETDVDLIAPALSRRPVAEEKALLQTLQALERAKNPIICIGAGANRKRVCNTLLQFIDKTGMYFCTTQMGKGVIDERHPQCLGTAALSLGDYVHCAIDRADLILNVGHDAVEKPPFFMDHNHKRTVVHVNFSSAQIDAIYFPQLEVVGDIAHTFWQLTKRIKPQSHWDFSEFKNIESNIESHVQERADAASFPVLPQRLVADVRSTLDDDAIIALDNGMYKIWFARNYHAHKPNTVLLDNALATMGAGLPSAIGAKISHPDRQVVAICGDGGFMMNSQELETAVRLGLHLVILVIRDDGYGMIKWKQTGMQLPSFGLDYSNPDFVEYAKSYGAHGHRIEATTDLSTVLQAALQSSGVHLIEVPIDYSENHRVLTEELSKRTCIL